MSMKAEILERLLMDRALGALPADVECLLAAYLVDRPETSRPSEEIRQTVDLARLALVGARPAAHEPLPPLAFAAAAPPGKRHRTLAILVRGAALAACLLIGVGLGGVLFSPSGGRTSPPVEVEVVRPAAGPDGPAGGSAAAHFWSVRRLYEQSLQAKGPGRAAAVWSWPFKRPRIGDRT